MFRCMFEVKIYQIKFVISDFNYIFNAPSSIFSKIDIILFHDFLDVTMLSSTINVCLEVQFRIKFKQFTLF